MFDKLLITSASASASYAKSSFSFAAGLSSSIYCYKIAMSYTVVAAARFSSSFFMASISFFASTSSSSAFDNPDEAYSISYSTNMLVYYDNTS